MKERIANISKRTWVRVILVTVLSIIVTFGYLGEKIPVHDGIGWDGMNYFGSMQEFVYNIAHQGYNQYDIRRALPWGITNIIYTILGKEVTVDTAIACGIIYNVIALFLSVFFFFRISNLKKWKLETDVLGFAFLFYTYPVLKFMGYYPVLSDIFGLTVGIMMCYYFFADKKWALIACGFLGAFIWPTTPVVAFALAFFPRKALPLAKKEDMRIEKIALYLFFMAIACFPLLIAIYKYICCNGDLATCGIYPLTQPMSDWAIILSCLCSCLFYYYIVSAFRISPISTLKESLTGKTIWKNYAWFFVCLLLTTLGSKMLANSEPGALTMKSTIYGIALTSFTDPFVFIESHFIFFGLGYLLVLFFWKDIAKILLQQGIGYLFVVAIWALFSIRPEARVSIMYVVFPIMALLMYLDAKNIRPYAVAGATIFSLVLSRFWFPFNAPGMEQAMDIENIEHFTDFPAQRYFMSSGHWQSHDMYYLFMAITIIVGVIIYAGIKNEWFVRKASN